MSGGEAEIRTSQLMVGRWGGREDISLNQQLPTQEGHKKGLTFPLPVSLTPIFLLKSLMLPASFIFPFCEILFNVTMFDLFFLCPVLI